MPPCLLSTLERAFQSVGGPGANLPHGYMTSLAKMKAMSKGGQVEEGEGDAVATVS